MKLRSPMPELIGEGIWLNGKVERHELIGEKPTIFHFWSISCYECRENMKHFCLFVEDYKEYVHFVAVHMPRCKEDTEVERIKDAAHKYKITQPIYVDNDLTISDLFYNFYVPSYYVFDQQGILRHLQSGNGGLKMLEKRLAKLLES